MELKSRETESWTHQSWELQLGVMGSQNIESGELEAGKIE